jgi:phenolic acid decarboxylase
MMIDINKKYRTREGNEVRIYAVDGAEMHEVHGAYKLNGGWISETWTKKGTYFATSESEIDLIEFTPWIPKDKEPVWCWENDYICLRELKFWDEINKATFTYNGKRIGVRFANYAKVEHIEPWMIEAQSKLQD